MTDRDERLQPVCPVCGARADDDPLPCHAGYVDALTCPAFPDDVGEAGGGKLIEPKERQT